MGRFFQKLTHLIVRNCLQPTSCDCIHLLLFLIMSFNLKCLFPYFWLFFLNMWGNNSTPLFLFCKAKPNFLSFQKDFLFPVSILVAFPCSCSQFNSHVLNMGDQNAHIPDVLLPICYTDSDTHSRQLHLRELLGKKKKKTKQPYSSDIFWNVE